MFARFLWIVAVMCTCFCISGMSLLRRAWAASSRHCLVSCTRLDQCVLSFAFSQGLRLVGFPVVRFTLVMSGAGTVTVHMTKTGLLTGLVRG